MENNYTKAEWYSETSHEWKFTAEQDQLQTKKKAE